MRGKINVLVVLYALIVSICVLSVSATTISNTNSIFTSNIINGSDSSLYVNILYVNNDTNVTGTVTANAFVGDGSGLTGVSTSDVWQNESGNVVLYDDANITGTAYATAFVGDGSGLTGVSASDVWQNESGNVVLYDDANVTGTVYATAFNGDGTNLTNVGNSTTQIQTAVNSTGTFYNISVQSSSFWSSVTSFISRWFYDNGDVLTFNETLLNSTIDARAGTNCNGSSCDVANTGTLDGFNGTDFLLNTGDTATGNYTFDTNTLHIDSSGNEIGIGTITPLGNVHVQNDVNGPVMLIIENVNAGGSATAQVNLTHNNRQSRIYNNLGDVTIRNEFTGGDINLRTVLGTQVHVNGGTGYVGINTTSATKSLDVAGNMLITNPFGGNSLKIDANGDAGASTSTGGALLIDNTDNPGAGLVIYSNEDGASAGHLLAVRADNAAFDQSGIYLSYDGVANAMNIVNSGTGASNGAINVASTNPSESTIKISGVETGRGTIKLVHSGNGTDANAAALSIDLQGTGTASQGIFLDATEGGTTGDLVELKNNGIQQFKVDADGNATVNGTHRADNYTLPNGCNWYVNGSDAIMGC